MISAEEMQRYAEQLILFSQSQTDAPTLESDDASRPGVGAGATPGTLPSSSAPVAGPAPTAVSVPEPVLSRPMQSMGAFDAYGGSIPADPFHEDDADTRRNKTPKSMAVASARAIRSSSSTGEYTDESRERDESGVSEAETDTDAETDDEPTIRPAHSCASSETQSLYSVDASEDGDEEEDAGDVSPRGRPLQSHRWANGAADGDRHMASP